MGLDKKGMLRLAALMFCAILFCVILQNLTAVLNAGIWLLGIFMPLIIGLCFVFIVNPMMSAIERALGKIGKKESRHPERRAAILRGVSLTLSVLILLGILGLLLLIILPEVQKTFKMFIAGLPSYAARAVSWLESWDLSSILPFGLSATGLDIDWNKILTSVISFFKEGQGQYLTGMVGATFSLLGAFWNGIFGVIIGVYVLAQKEKVGSFTGRLLLKLLGERNYGRLVSFSKVASDAFSRFISGQLLEALIIGVLCYIGMLIFGFPYALVSSAIIGFTALIPVFGAWIGAIAGALLILTVQPAKTIWFLIYILVLQQVEGNLIYPKVVGKSVGLPGLLVILAVWFGGSLGGMAGMLLGVPFCSVLYTLVKRFLGPKPEASEDAPVEVGSAEAEADGEPEADDTTMQ